MVKIIIIFGFFYINAIAAENYDEINYDNIIQELSKYNTPKNGFDPEDPFDNVLIHLGAGLANSVYSLPKKSGSSGFISHRGIQLSLGIDLFTPQWICEGDFINYSERDFDKKVLSMKEFDLKLYYKSYLDKYWRLNLGGGLAGRYLTLEGQDKEDYTTPASLLMAGVDFYFTRKLSLGTEVTARNSLTNDTPDKNAFDFIIRIDSHF